MLKILFISHYNTNKMHTNSFIILSVNYTIFLYPLLIIQIDVAVDMDRIYFFLIIKSQPFTYAVFPIQKIMYPFLLSCLKTNMTFIISYKFEYDDLKCTYKYKYIIMNRI